MTLGEKIKEARKNTGLSQEQLAEKLAVSRSAIAKWESDKGLPDIDNLKALSMLLNVSIDYLLDNEISLDLSVIREPYILPEFERGSKKKKKDKIIRNKFPDAVIHPLIMTQKLTKSEIIIDNTLGFLTDAPFGTPGLINSFKNMNKEFYLVNQGEQQYLVCIDEEFIETRKIMTPITSKKFEIGSWKFLKCRYVVK